MCRVIKMLPRGLEPRTLGLLDLRSDQLSYESVSTINSKDALAFFVAQAQNNRQQWAVVGVEPTTSPTLRENHTTRPLALHPCQYNISGIMAEWLRRWT